MNQREINIIKATLYLKDVNETEHCIPGYSIRWASEHLGLTFQECIAIRNIIQMG